MRVGVASVAALLLLLLLAAGVAASLLPLLIVSVGRIAAPRCWKE